MYQIEVIPRSNVDRAMNGTPVVVKGLFTYTFIPVQAFMLMFSNFPEKFVNFQISQVQIVKEENQSQNVTVTVEFTPDEDVRNCNNYIMSLYLYTGIYIVHCRFLSTEFFLSDILWLQPQLMALMMNHIWFLKPFKEILVVSHLFFRVGGCGSTIFWPMAAENILLQE